MFKKKEKKYTRVLAENIDLHIIHMHLHIEFKRLCLQVTKINSVICRNCVVPIQSPGHCISEIHNMFKNHISEDERCQSATGGCTSVILTGSRDCLAWLQCKIGKATALKCPHLRRKPAWVGARPREFAALETMVPRALPPCHIGKSSWCLNGTVFS